MAEPGGRILVVIREAEPLGLADLLEALSPEWEVLTCSPEEADSLALPEGSLAAVLVAAEEMSEAWAAQWKQRPKPPLVIRVSPQAARAESIPEGPWDWVLPASFPWPRLRELLSHRSMDSKPAVPVRKVLLAGEATVGKTSLVHCYLHGAFEPRRRMTVGVDIHVCPVEVEGMAVRLVVWDVGGQRRFAAFRDLFYRGAAAGALVFDLSNRLSFYQLIRWWQELRAHAGSIPLLLVGNKADLPREVSRREAEALAQAWGTPYVETSCVTGIGVAELFRTLAGAALQATRPEPE